MVIETYGLADDELMHYGVMGMKWGHRKALKSYTSFQSHKDKNASYLSKADKAKAKGNDAKAAKLTAKAKKHESEAWKALAKTKEQIATNNTNIKEKYKKKLDKIKAKDMSATTIKESQGHQQKAVKVLDKMNIKLATYADEHTLNYDYKLKKAQDKYTRDTMIGGAGYAMAKGGLKDVTEIAKRRKDYINGHKYH